MAEIASAVTAVITTATQLGKIIAGPIKHKYKILFSFKKNMQILRDKVENLKDAKDGVVMIVDDARRNAEVILPEVETWLKKVEEIMLQINEVLDKIPIAEKHFRSRFSLNKKVRKLTDAMNELLQGSKFQSVSKPRPPASLSLGSIPLRDTYEFESRKEIEEDIMGAVRSKQINTIGICGMGGVGKTTLARRIMHQVREKHLCDEITFVVVGQRADMSNVQHELAESLGLKLEEKNVLARGNILRDRLSMSGGKRTLVVLDDVWESLSLEDLGVPNGSACLVVLTSRNRDICQAMNVDEVFALSTLFETEALPFFRDRVGNCVDDQSLVEAVVRECNGLPLALAVVARALKNNTEKGDWRGAIQQLRTSNPVDMPPILAEVYNPIKLSYDYLQNEHAKIIFLVCSLFPEDYDIPLQELVSYSMGLGMFDDIDNLGKARDTVSILLTMLKSRFLLLDGERKKNVKMHDIVRDVAIFIASEEGRITRNIGSVNWLREHTSSNCTWFSSFSENRATLATRLNFPNLRLLLAGAVGGKEFGMDEAFFEGMRGLNAVSIRSASLSSLPQTIQILKNLRTLVLHECKSLETISIVGELSTLEILSCYRCQSIKELSKEIGRLSCLKRFELSACMKLKKIEPGVISSLLKLEELKILDSFDEWEMVDEGKERKNASLAELQSLASLTSLEIDFKDSSFAGQDFDLPANIVRYDIRIGAINRDRVSGVEEKGFDRKMHLELSRGSPLGNWVHIFLRNSEALCLSGDYSDTVDLLQLQNIKWLEVTKCSRMKALVHTTRVNDWSTGVFPSLDYLKLDKLPNLEEIRDGRIPDGSSSFRNLKKLKLRKLPQLKHLWWSEHQNVSLRHICSISVVDCEKLSNLFSLRTARDCVSQLSKLEISGCTAMEEVLGNAEDSGPSHMTFPKLQKLFLRRMPKLKTFCTRLKRIEFPVLTEMKIMYCQELKSLVSSTCNHGDDDSTLHLFCNPEVAFASLRELEIRGYHDIRKLWCQQISPDFFRGLERLLLYWCSNIRSVFSNSIIPNLINLKELSIFNCSEMVTVVEGGDIVWETCALPNLQEVILVEMYKLTSFCEWRFDVELPSLRKVLVSECREMKGFTLGSVTTPKLKMHAIDEENCVTDLNDAVRKLCREKDYPMVERDEIEDIEVEEEIVDPSDVEEEEDCEAEGLNFRSGFCSSDEDMP